MRNDEIRDVVISAFRNKNNMAAIGEDQNFFDAGVSSLTIIELQIKVEEILGITGPTREGRRREKRKEKREGEKKEKKKKKKVD